MAKTYEIADNQDGKRRADKKVISSWSESVTKTYDLSSLKNEKSNIEGMIVGYNNRIDELNAIIEKVEEAIDE